MFSTAIDLHRRRVTVSISSPFGSQEGHDCAISVQQAVGRHQWVTGTYDLLIDATAVATQPQSVASSILEVSRHAEFKARHVACSSPSPLARLQLRRILPDRDVHFFNSVEEAAQWLDQQ